MALFLLSVLYLAFSVSEHSIMVDAARILCASHQFGSHLMMVHTTVENMISRGNEVYTIYSDKMPIPKGLEEKGFKILKYHTPEQGRIMSDPGQEANTLKVIFEGARPDFTLTSAICAGECKDIDNDKRLEKQLFDLKFDLVVLGASPLSNCLMMLPLKLKIPFVTVIPAVDPETTRAPVLPSFYPVPLFQFSDNMTFRERAINTLYTILMITPSITPFLAISDTSLLAKYNNDSSVTTWNSLARKAHLHFVSRGEILEYPIPLFPNVINIECLSCKPGHSLSQEIQKIIESSTGIIVVSFGSLIARFPDPVAAKFLSAFAKRQEVIFWRYKAKLPGTVPPNVKVMKWLPQNDLLAHPKTKLFITHSGNNGQYESVYHGVPMLAFPLFAEQHHNAHRIGVHGYGIESNINTFTSEELTEKIAKVINEPSYREKTQHASRILKERPMNARETAAYWIEHVLEFGADHLKSHALNMPWYSFYMIDVIFVFQVVLAAIFLFLILIIILIYQKFAASQLDSKQKKH